MTLSPLLMQRLSRARLLGPGAVGNVGVGERRSREKGPGLEFADYRNYEPGDDLRYLDLQHYARRGELNIRQYEVTRALAVSVLVDTSRSMNFGEPNKLARVRDLAELIAFVGLAGGDTVQVLSDQNGVLHRSTRVSGIDRAPIPFAAIERLEVSDGDFTDVFNRVAATLASGSLLVVISDWWNTIGDADLAALRGSHCNLLAVHVVAPQEENPALSAGSDLRIADSETGLEIDFTADRIAVEDYQREYAAWCDELRRRIQAQGFRYVRVETSADLAETALVSWRLQGISHDPPQPPPAVRPTSFRSA